MSTWIEKASAHRAKRDASIPKAYLADLSSASIPSLPEESLPLPYSKAKPHMPEPTMIYPTDSVISAPSKLLSLEDNAITTTRIDKLLELLATGKLSSVRCTEAFLRRAVLAHQLTNCCTDIFASLALERAKQCDEYLATNGKPIGLLHGLPVSLKDQFDIAGKEMTMGYVGWIGRIAKQNSVITDVILKQGGVVYVRTSIPQSLMRCETHNHIYGRTVSPFNRSFTPGGSSGGEGALVGMHGSPLGLGTDIGGSVRVPSAFNGLWGMRPSMHRIPYEGAANSFLGQESVSSVIGPLTHSLEGVVTFLRAVLAERPWELDPILVAMPFNEPAYALQNLELKQGSSEPEEVYTPGETKLCFAIEWDDGVIHPHPPITRALREVKQKLESAGHTVIDWIPYHHDRAYDIISRIYSADGGEDIQRSCDAGGEPVMYNLMSDGKPKTHLSTWESWQVNQEKSQYRKEYLDYWQGTKEKTGTGRAVDAIVAPVSSWASCKHDTNDYVGYTTQWK